MDLTVQNIYELLLRSNLLPPEEVKAMYGRWLIESKEHGSDPARFSAWMVANRYVTEYQATLLARGYAEGFFLNEYKILGRTGKGRMAGVYRAKHRLGQTVAIKVLPPSKARDPILLARFQRESHMVTRLRHPNVVQGFQMGTQGDLHYLVMEFLDGVTVADMLAARGKLPTREAVRLAFQAFSGLQHLHEQGLVHRDLKPANMMLVPPPTADSTLNCTLKILDIGLGRALRDENSDSQDPALTTEGDLLGTPDYLAPEQCRDPRNADIRADIYSLGCVLYHLLTGQPPFPDTNLINQMIRHATEQPKPLREFDRGIPDGLEQILGWMLAKDPAGRYPTPLRAAKALEVFLTVASDGDSKQEADARLSSYLTWLEEEERKQGVGDGAEITTVPVVYLPPEKPKGRLAPPSEQPAPRPAKPREEKKARKKTSLPPVSPQEEEVAEVELVEEPAEVRAPPILGKLTRRDLVMYFLGVGSGIALLAVLKSLFGPTKPRHGEGE